MKSLEMEGKTIDDAIEKACEELHVAREKLNIEIISEGAAGFLGIGNKKARIKATVLSLDEALSDSLPPAPPESPESGFSVNAAVVVQGDVKEEESTTTAEHAKVILEGILQRMDFPFSVSVKETAEKIILNIEGNSEGLLIGRRGQNLDALQYVVNKAAHKSNNSRKMIVVDTESYRERREEALIALAAKIGAKVKKTKKSVTLSYLNAHNRRIIHMALQDDASLNTKSRGEGDYRKIVIVPAKKDSGNS